MRRRPWREAWPAQERQRDRAEGAKAACGGRGHLEGGQVARDRDWYVQRISNELSSGPATDRAMEALYHAAPNIGFQFAEIVSEQTGMPK